MKLKLQKRKLPVDYHSDALLEEDLQITLQFEGLASPSPRIFTMRKGNRWMDEIMAADNAAFYVAECGEAIAVKLFAYCYWRPMPDNRHPWHKNPPITGRTFEALAGIFGC